MQEQSLDEIIENYKKAPAADFWQVTSNKLRQVVDQIQIDTIRGMSFNKVLDFACGLGVIAREIAGQSGYVLGMDGAPPAIQRARELNRDIKNIEFRIGSLDDLKKSLRDGLFDLLVITDALSYFNREEQRSMLKWASSANVTYCLLGIHVVNPLAKKSKKRFADGCDFMTLGEIRDFMSETDYEIRKCNVCRVYLPDDISRWEVYSKWQKQMAIFVKRWMIDALTAIFNVRARFKGDKVYDPLVLRKRLDWFTWGYKIPILKRFIEPAISFVVLLCRKKKQD